MAAHAALEAFTLPKEMPRKTIHVLLHLKLDIVLVIFALWLAVYFESIFGLLGLSAASRTAAQGGARFLAWQKSIKGALMTVDDAAQLARGVMRVRAKTGIQEDTENDEANKSLGKTDWLIISSGIAMSLGIALASFIIDTSYNDVLNIFINELTPIPTS